VEFHRHISILSVDTDPEPFTCIRKHNYLKRLPFFIETRKISYKICCRLLNSEQPVVSVRMPGL
jgi:hypothetical protein